MSNHGEDRRPGNVTVESRLGRLVVATTVLGSAMGFLTSTIVNVALPSLARDLGATSAQQQWVVNAYLIAVASLILAGGSLGDVLGRVRIYRVGVVGFAGASLLAALAPTIGLLIAARVLQGIAGALLIPGSLSILEATILRDDRGRAIGQWSGLTALAAAVGPLAGGLLVELSWRWIFLVNLPIAVAVFLMSRQLPESVDPERGDHSVDVVGAGLATLALGGLAFGLTQGPQAGFALVDAISLVLGVVAAIVLVVYERRQENPMVPLGLFADRVFAAANGITLVVYGALGVVFFLLVIHLQVTVGWSPLQAGAAVLPVTLIMLAISPKAGDLAHDIGPRIPLVAGPLLLAAGMLLYTRIGPDASYLSDVLPGVLVFGFGLGISVAPVTATALESVPDARSGAASGANNAVSRTGQALAVAAIPPLVGLTGDALNDPERLAEGFPVAMAVAATLGALGAAVSALFLRGDDLGD